MNQIKQVHAQIILQGLTNQSLTLGKLIAFCAVNHAGNLEYAQLVFDQIKEPNKFMYNSLIRGYSNCDNNQVKAVLLYREMVNMGHSPNEFTLPFVLKACAFQSLYWVAILVHGHGIKLGIGSQVCVQNGLINVYVVCGLLLNARKVFDDISDRTLVSWNSMIGGYSKMGCCKEAFLLFKEMRELGLELDGFSLVSLLSVCSQNSCSQVGDLVMGKKVHDYVLTNDIIPSVTLRNALIDMYAKCGSLGIAMDIFNEMPKKNLVSWNVVIGALALHGRGLRAVELFEEMQAGRNRIWPDEFTFMGLLSACSHSGLVDEGRYYFERMESFFRVSHEIEHYACMVDLFGRWGLVEEAVRLIGGMPMKPDVVVWGALLGACRIHANVEIGKLILKQFLELEPNSSGLYVLLSNLFCESHRWEDVKNIRKLMNDRGIIKCRAISFIEIEGRVYEFMVDEKGHETSSNIYTMLDQLTDQLRSIGYSCNHLISSFDAEEI
ncbi:hypothetical protein Dsin_010635 [Dipteronia sinensis]|uniref:Pentatricopeptide repeat-containing protein n=1 Tax=Dipteronia sinensis TaxID=43782 RepID=A0AAE0ATM7_9ROSI|nr:hypothetical protein Dsin_010635 [Dipteronia sinensis]